MTASSVIINAEQIESLLKQNVKEDKEQIRAILTKARAMRGLDLTDVAILAQVQNSDLLDELFATAKEVKETIYGKRLVIFAPLYISNLCSNDCAYCAFRASNKALRRRSLSQTEIAAEVKALVDQGQKRLLLVAGEAYSRDGFQYILDAIDTVYSVKHNHGEIRRLNVNIAPLTLEDFKRLKQKNIGTYQLFQETYHPVTYQQVHLGGKKTDYDWRLTAIDRAMEAGIDDVGVGVLFGLADWRFEILALMQHTQHLERQFGIGPHTISVPRLEPALGSTLADNPPNPVTDLDFEKIIAILRLAVPYTGIILSTRENQDMRRKALALGVSQISAGSRTNPGGYADDQKDMSQFSLGDHRSLDEVIYDVASLGYIPSFCTGCYRLGRTGHDFMDLAKPGKIKDMCGPNALTTFEEYLMDYGSAKTRAVGEKVIQAELAEMDEEARRLTTKLLERIKKGEHDVFI